MLLNAIDDPDSRDGATAKLACRQRIYRLTGPVSSRSKRFWQLSLVLIGLARVRPGVLSWVSDYSESANTTSASATGPRSWMSESEAATPRWAVEQSELGVARRDAPLSSDATPQKLAFL